jgi:hypothetical protein
LVFVAMAFCAGVKLQADLLISEVGRNPSLELIYPLATRGTMEAKYYAALHKLAHVKGNQYLTDGKRRNLHAEAYNTLKWVKNHAPGYQQIEYGLTMAEELRK